MLQKRVPPRVIPKPDLSTNTDATIRFDSTNAVRGIVYHLLDEKLARSVNDDSIQGTIHRLGSQTLSVGQLRWTGMTNSQRLNWLLSETRTITISGDNDVVALLPRR